MRTKLGLKVRRAIRVIARVKERIAKHDVHPESEEGLAMARRAAQAAAVIDRRVGARARTDLLRRAFRGKAFARETIYGVERCGRCLGVLAVNGVVTIWRGKEEDDVDVEAICDDCDFRERAGEFEEKGELGSFLTRECALMGHWLEHRSDRYREKFKRRALEHQDLVRRVNEHMDRIHEAAKRFEKEAWFGGLQDLVRAEEHRGLSGRLKGVKMLTCSSAARWMATISDAKTGAQVTVITEEDSDRSRMGVQSVAGTVVEALLLLDFAREHWREMNLAADSKVRIA